MTKEEIAKRVEDDIALYLKTFKTDTREHASKIMLWLNIYCFYADKLTENDLIEYGKYVGYGLDMEAIKREKEKFIEEMSKKGEVPNNEEKA